AFSLPDTETVTWRVLDGALNVLRATSLGTLAAGAHSFEWHGAKDAGGTIVGSGNYTIQLVTTNTVGDTTFTGQTQHGVTVDKIPPAMSSLTGSGEYFYPYPDGYRDT